MSRQYCREILVVIAVLTCGANAAQAVDRKVVGQVVDGITGNPLPGATLTFYQTNYQHIVLNTTTGGNGWYEVIIPEGLYKVSAIATVSGSQKQVVRYLLVAGGDKALNMRLINRHAPGGEFARLIFGLDQAAATSANATWKYFFDLTLSVPFPVPQEDHPDFGPRLRLWGNARIASVPQQITAKLSEFNLPSSVANLQVNQLAQTMAFRGGLSWRIPFPLDSLHLSFDKSTLQKFTGNVLIGAGGATPLNPRDTLEIFNVSPDAVKLYPQAQGKQYIGFTAADRDRFYRQLFGGFQVKSHYFDKQTEEPLDRFPATFDFTYGIDESVTRGYIRGGVFRAEMFYPLPSTFGSNFYFFFSAILKPARPRINDPLLLEAAPSTVGLADVIRNGVRVSLPQIDRDYYRVGIGMDFIRLIQYIQNRGQEAGQTTH